MKTVSNYWRKEFVLSVKLPTVALQALLWWDFQVFNPACGDLFNEKIALDISDTLSKPLSIPLQ